MSATEASGTIRTVSIVGVGLIGGSFGLALKRAGFQGRILGVSRPQTIENALAAGAIDAGAPLDEALGESDLVLLAQPILRILEQLPEIARLARPGSLVTDAGSTKAAIVARGEELFAGTKARFLGGHPMAGKEGRGVEIAEANLFEGAVWALTPAGGALDEPIEAEFVRLLRSIRARPLTLSAAEHDAVTALTSHVPQLVSTALATAVSEGLPRQERLQIAGKGLRDMTRLAGSSYAIWEGILRTNPEAIRDGLDRVIAELTVVRDALEDPALAERFEIAQALHRKLRSV